jgi:MarR family transcriptional regulator, organic hydroperoxide resistance regulator
VRRSPDTEDSRISRVYLTEQGRNNQQGVREIWIGLEQRMNENLTTKERMLLRRLLLQVHIDITFIPDDPNQLPMHLSYPIDV